MAFEIQWYPGHIAKAQRKLREKLSLVDCVVEVVDARLPISTHFDFIDEVAQNKPRIVMISKEDLVSDAEIEAALAYWRAKGYTAIKLNTPQRKGVEGLRKALDKEYQVLSAKMKKRGRLPRKLRTMVLGAPNVGKSSLINALCKKRSLKVGNKPGVTRALQWISIAKNLELLDTPGVIPPKFDDQRTAVKLALIGSISEHSAHPAQVAEASLKVLSEEFPDFVQKVTGALGEEALHSFAFKRSFIQQGESADLERAAIAFLHEFRKGKFGLLQLEEIPDEEHVPALESEDSEAE